MAERAIRVINEIRSAFPSGDVLVVSHNNHWPKSDIRYWESEGGLSDIDVAEVRLGVCRHQIEIEPHANLRLHS